MNKFISGAVQGAAVWAGKEYAAPLIPFGGEVAGFDLKGFAVGTGAAYLAGKFTGGTSLLNAALTAAAVVFATPYLANIPSVGEYLDGVVGAAAAGAALKFVF